MQSLSAPQRGPQALRTPAMGLLILRNLKAAPRKEMSPCPRTMIHQRSRSRTALTLVTVKSYFFFASQTLHNRKNPKKKISEHFSFFINLWCIFFHFITIYIEGEVINHPLPTPSPLTHPPIPQPTNPPQPARIQPLSQREPKPVVQSMARDTEINCNYLLNSTGEREEGARDQRAFSRSS
jgi:hypothetical protein